MTHPSRDDWRTKAEQDLGRSLDSIVWRTADGCELSPLLTREDVQGLPHRNALSRLSERRGFAVHELVTEGDPEAAADHARRALSLGADEIEICLDPLGQDASEPSPWSEDVSGAEGDDDLAGWSAPGEGGVAIHTRADFDATIAGLDLASTSLWFAAGESAVPILGWWADAAERAGANVRRIRGGVDFDPHGRLTARRVALRDDTRAVARRSEPRAIWEEAAGIVRWTREHCPEVRPLVIDGQVYHLAGGTPALEVGATLAGLVEIARELGSREADFAALAAASMVRVQVGHEILPEIAKLRALRLLWTKVATAFGYPDARPRILAVTSGRQRAEDFDQRTNLIRTTFAAFAAIAGGVDALHVHPFDDAENVRGARDLAREQQLLLREEGQLDRVADPLAGSAAIEVLTDAIGRRAWEVLQDIEKRGGLWATMRDGWLAERLHAQESLREADVRMRRRVLVGINRFADHDLGGPVGSADLDEQDAATDRRIRAFEAFRARRDAGRAASVVAAIREAAPHERPPASAQPGHEHATLAELATAAWPAEGHDLEHRFVPVAAADGDEFEDLRANVMAAEMSGRRAPEVLLLPLGPVRTARARADFARDLFEVGGFRVRDHGSFDSLDAAVAFAEASRPAIVVLCGDDRDYAALVPKLRESLGRNGPLLVVAGRVPDAVKGAVDHEIRAGLDAAGFLAHVQRELGLAAEA